MATVQAWDFQHMYRWVLTVFTLLLLALATAASAQTGDWVQVEAHPDLSTAEARAKAYAAQLPDVVGYQLPSGWYAIALGPFAPNEAQAELAKLRASGAIPPDSYIADGADYGQQFWPAGATATTGIQQAALAPQTPAAPAAAQTADATPQPGAALPDETPAEARRSEALLTRDDRMELQRALAWYGDYSGAIDGDFGPGTRGAMAAWQGAKGYDGTGILTTGQRKILLDGYRSEEAALGLKTVNDANAGISIDLPLALVQFTKYQPPFAHFATRGDSGVQAVLISAPGGRATLSGLYDLLQTLTIMPTAGARDLSNRSFDITGTGDTMHAFAHAELADGAVKGYLIAWKPADDARMAHVLAAMKASFRSTGQQSLDGSMVPLTAGQKRGMVAGLSLRKPIAARSGFFVDASGDVLTTTAVLQNCGSISFGDRHKATVAFRDDSLGIALLKPKDGLAPQAYAQFAQASLAPAAQVAAAGYSYGGQLIAAALTFGSFEASQGLNGEPDLRRLSLAALPGDAGGPVLDATGALVGMLMPHPSDSTKVLPKTVNFAAGAAPIAAALQAQGITLAMAQPGKPKAPEDLAALGRKMTVLVSCWK
jgi:peptidoglycan hydrolase-like protein with peptidoglycan-binding domain